MGFSECIRYHFELNCCCTACGDHVVAQCVVMGMKCCCAACSDCVVAQCVVTVVTQCVVTVTQCVVTMLLHSV